jgi:hypothetical protein
MMEMNETNHIKHRYRGTPNEPVTIHVTADGTNHMVTYNLDDIPQPALPAGTPITFNLGSSSGDLTRLQLIMDFNAEGSYEIEIENVDDCTADTESAGTCKHTREGPPLVIENYKFSVA